MATLLIPGRHLITSSFMVSYLHSLLKKGITVHPLLGEWSGGDVIDHIVIPITSANQRGSRYNPVPLYARIIGLERTVAPFRASHNVRISFIPVPHIGPSPHFAEITIKYVKAHLGESLSPGSALIWCSTANVFDQYRALGFAILPAEFSIENNEYAELPPNEILAALTAAPDSYTSITEYALLSDATKSLWKDMPEIPEHVVRLWNDPLLTDSGSLTEERDYATYAVGMSHTALMDIKFNDIKDAVVEGKIADEGCADGALMVRLAETFPDSDIIGIDITGEFISRVEERQRAGEFKKSFVYVYQRNLLQPVFSNNSVDTVICNSTLHELWSYGDQAKSVRNYLRYKYKQLTPGGRLVIRDVVGPEHKNTVVYMKLNTLDGETYGSDDGRILSTPPEQLSTASRFFRFVHDFLRELSETGRRTDNYKVLYTQEEVQGISYIKLALKDATEFLLTKDYTDNWHSEMNEEFTFWDINEWKQELTKVGFVAVNDDSADPKYSKAYANEWIIKNRYQPTATLWTMNESGKLVEFPYPVTNMVLVGEKPLG
jgi:ubiquinone/menaquinone biosynthesis C-methylase UbiE